MILALIGSRDFNDYDFFQKEVKRIICEKGWDVTEIVSGKARGTDTLAWKYALLNKLKLTEFKPDWDTYGKVAGHMRNTLIVNYCNALIAFQKNKSNGTQDSINKVDKAGKEFVVIDVTF